MRRKIVINASTVLISGGLYLTQGIIKSVLEDNSLETIIICPSLRKYESFDTENSSLLVVPKWQLNRMFRLCLDYIWLPLQIRRIKPDLVFSMTNIPARTSVKQIYLHDNPYFLCETLRTIKLSIWEQILQRLRSYFTRERLRFVDLIIVQSEYYAKKLKREVRDNVELTILTPSIPDMLDLDFGRNLYKETGNKLKILCLSRYFKHKNIEILLEVARLIKDKNLPYVLYITIDVNQHKNAARILSAIRKDHLDKIIINLGRIDHNHTGNYIRNCDAMILPSLLESFSLNFVEAWAYQKPIFISETEANRDACKDAAFYFNPKAEKGILESLDQLQDPGCIQDMVRKGNRRVKSLSSWKDYVYLIRTFQI